MAYKKGIKKGKTYPIRARKPEWYTLKRLGSAILRDNDYRGYGSTSDALEWMFEQKEIVRIVEKKIKDTK